MVLTIELPDEKIAALAAKALAQGVSAEQYAQRVLEQDIKETKPRRHISQVIADLANAVPDDIMEAMPKDGASEHDHYIYGLPKRNS